MYRKGEIKMLSIQTPITAVTVLGEAGGVMLR